MIRCFSIFAQRTQAEWTALLDGSDACVAPVLNMDEAPHHPHAAQRQAYVDVDGVRQAAPAPRFDRSPADAPRPAPHIGQHTREVLLEAGYNPTEIDALLGSGVAKQA